MTVLGTNLKKYRVDAGITLPRMAHQAGVSVGYLTALENGRAPSPRLDRLMAVARAYDLSPGLVVWWAMQDVERREPRP